MFETDPAQANSAKRPRAAPDRPIGRALCHRKDGADGLEGPHHKALTGDEGAPTRGRVRPSGGKGLNLNGEQRSAPIPPGVNNTKRPRAAPDRPYGRALCLRQRGADRLERPHHKALTGSDGSPTRGRAMPSAGKALNPNEEQRSTLIPPGLTARSAAGHHPRLAGITLRS
jgi:hypothetical protein